MENKEDDQPYQEREVSGWTVRHFDSIDSTNGYLTAVAASQDPPHRLVAVAEHQTAGRGRHGRVWDDKPGASVLMSILFARPTLPPFSYGMALGLAVTDACAVVAGVNAVLKWPNDVLVEGRKLAGVLAEASSDTGAIVVGSGVNLNWGSDLPASLSDRAISLDEAAGSAIQRDDFLAGVLSALSTRIGRPDWISSSYRSRCATLGKAVRVDMADGVVEGQAVDLTEDGALVVDVAGDRRTVTVGDVVHLRAF